MDVPIPLLTTPLDDLDLSDLESLSSGQLALIACGLHPAADSFVEMEAKALLVERREEDSERGAAGGPSPYPAGKSSSLSPPFLRLPDDEWGLLAAGGRANAEAPSRTSLQRPPTSCSRSADSKRRRLTSPPPSSRAWSRDATSAVLEPADPSLPARPPPQSSIHYLSPRAAALGRVVGPLEDAKELPPSWDWRRLERHDRFFRAVIQAFRFNFELPVPGPPPSEIRPFLQFAPRPSSLPTLHRLPSAPPQHARKSLQTSKPEKRLHPERCRLEALQYLCKTDAFPVVGDHLDWVDHSPTCLDFLPYLRCLGEVRRKAYALGLDGLDESATANPWRLILERVREVSKRGAMSDRQQRFVKMLEKGLLGDQERDVVVLDWEGL